MRDLEQVEDASINQTISYPYPKTRFSLEGMHTADSGVGPSGFDLDGAKNNPEGPFNSVGGNHFACMTGIGGV